MSSQRYTPEFRDEAVRQIVDRGRSVNWREIAVNESFFSSLKRERITRNGLEKSAIWCGQMSSITSSRSTIEDATIFPATSVPRSLSGPRCEAGPCPPLSGSPAIINQPAPRRFCELERSCQAIDAADSLVYCEEAALTK